jgi:hypothetical protein
MSLFVDVHIHFSLCDCLAFKMLDNSYLRLKDQKAFLSGGGYFSERGELEFGQDQRDVDCESEHTEHSYKIGHHGVANGR